MIETSVVIPAAGQGRRFNASFNKNFALLGNKPILAWSLEAFESNNRIDEIILVVGKNETDQAQEIVRTFGIEKLSGIITGGSERQESVFKGLKLVKGKNVLIHDGARPLVSQPLINRVIDGVIQHESAIPATPVVDTIKYVENHVITGTLDRKKIRAVQTPQGFTLDLILQAHEKAEIDGFMGTDDAGLVERMGKSVHVVSGDAHNIKITTPADLEYAELLIYEKRKKTMPSIKIGYGYDIHRFSSNRKLFIGGVEIPFDRGLLGHSDADVLLHAICDALLGAIGSEDIGVLFPNNDPEYLDISSLKLLELVVQKVKETGYTVNNIDATLVAEAPKISPYVSEMKRRIAKAVDIDISSLGIKATTAEKLDAVGEGLGAEAYAVAIVVKTL